MKKKNLSILLASGMLLSGMLPVPVSAEESKTSDSTKTIKEIIAEEESEIQLPITEEPITLSIFAPSNNEYKWEDNLETKELEEETGIHINWITAASSDNIQEKLSTIFASGDLPDIIFTSVGKNRFDKSAEQSLGEQGLVIPLNDYIENISVGYRNAFNNIDGLKEYMTTPDGNIYSLPNIGGNLHVQYNMKLWLNTQWLDNLGLEMPTTTDELYEVLKAFKEQDANGNGDPNDEIPLSTVTSGSGTQLDGFLMNPFQLTSEDVKMYVDDGTVTYAPVQDGYKEGLKYLNKLYSEGLINPESFTQDKNNQVNINEAGDECVIGAFLAQRPGYACDLSTEPYSKKWQQYQSVAPLTGPDGQCIASWDPYTNIFQTGMTFITSSCEHPEEAFKLLDYLATTKMFLRSGYGRQGIEWDYLDDSSDEVGEDGTTKATFKRLNSSEQNVTWGQLACLVGPSNIVLQEAAVKDPYADDVKPLLGRMVVLYKASVEHEKVRQPIESVFPSLYMAQEDADEVNLLKTTIQDNQKQYMVDFIIGTKNIDDEWDSYKSTLDNLGLERYLELLQKAYDESAFNKTK